MKKKYGSYLNLYKYFLLSIYILASNTNTKKSNGKNPKIYSNCTKFSGFGVEIT